MSDVFNTVFEMSLRVVLLLSDGASRDCNELATIDFVTTYSRGFSEDQVNVNGDNRFMYSEYEARCELVKSAVKDLVLKGLILPKFSSEGYTYKLTDAGRGFSTAMSSEYASDYSKAIPFAITYIEEHGLKAVIKEINRNKKRTVKR